MVAGDGIVGDQWRLTYICGKRVKSFILLLTIDLEAMLPGVISCVVSAMLRADIMLFGRDLGLV